MRKELALIAVVAAMFTLLATSAQSMPVSPPKGISKDQTVTQVRGGCGPGWRRNRWGRCRPI